MLTLKEKCTKNDVKAFLQERGTDEDSDLIDSDLNDDLFDLSIEISEVEVSGTLFCVCGEESYLFAIDVSAGLISISCNSCGREYDLDVAIFEQITETR